MNRTVSVIIPCYNEEKYIKNCLQSIMAQTRKPFEIIVIDNNCTDKTVDIAKSMKVKVIKEQNQGMIPARNRGFNEAKGEILARTDADSIAEKKWIEQITEKFSNDKQIAALTGSFTFNLSPKFLRLPLKLVVELIYMPLSRIMAGHHILNGPNYALKRSAWEKIKPCPDDKKVHEDIDMAIHLNKVGKIGYFPEIKTEYSMRRWKKKFFSTFFEYSLRFLNTLYFHKHNIS